MKRLLKIGLTGGMASGKSLALKFLAVKGIPVLQSDHLGHKLYKDKKIAKSIYRNFGNAVFGKKGKVDRKKLSEEAFRNPFKLRKLNSLTHPIIFKMVKEWASQQKIRNSIYPLLVVEVPLLFETGFNRFFDGVLCISAPLLIRRKRLLKRGLSLSQIKLCEKYQWLQSRKNQKADWVILNQKGPKQLKYAVDQWLRQWIK